jgi:uncharacterized protein YukE
MRSAGSKLTGASAEAERLFKSAQSLTNRLAVTWRGPGGVQFQQAQARLMPDLRRAELDLKLAADSLFDAAAEYERFEQAVNRNVTRLRADGERPAQAAYGVGSERSAQTAHAVPGERPVQTAHAVPGERPVQTAHATPGERSAQLTQGADGIGRSSPHTFAPPGHAAAGAGVSADLGAAAAGGARDAAMLGVGGLGGLAGRGPADDAVSTIAQAWSEASDLVSVEGWSGGPDQRAHALLAKAAGALGLGGPIPESQRVHHDLETLHRVIQQYGRQSQEARAAAMTLCQHAQQLHQSLAGKIPGLSAVLPVPTYHA